MLKRPLARPLAPQKSDKDAVRDLSAVSLSQADDVDNAQVVRNLCLLRCPPAIA